MASVEEIPKQYKAVVYDAPPKVSTKVVTLDVPEPGPGEVLIHLTHSGVCYSDLAIMTNGWKMLPYPTQPTQVGGHEGVGKVVKFGPGAETGSIKLGDRVGVKWISRPCFNCPACFEGFDGVCRNAAVSGYYTPGTFQQYVLGPANYVTPIPDALPSADACPLLCAGITTYSAFSRSNARAGQWVVISGAGGGLGHIACQIGSRGLGMRIIGIDSGSKKDIVLESGAEHFIDVAGHDDASIKAEVKKLTGGLGAAAVLVCTASNKAYAQAIGMLKFNGTLVCVGMPEGEMVPIAEAFPTTMVAQLHNITSTAVGNRKEANEIMEMAARGVVKTRVKVVKMEELTSVFEEMKAGTLHGRVVLDLS